LQGIMVIPPVDITDEDFALADKEPPELFRSMRRLADTVGMGKLSLGMSSDYRTALAAGSDCVRIGRSLFGERQK
ncbi:MAG: YggS family pyridoxal phosphate-dependent enzyme, partial [Proteobacteria bacterium]|nr:YggS family pyridoxal phosphate-dependent enzyme [Pseudomonadota bacterium]